MCVRRCYFVLCVFLWVGVGYIFWFVFSVALEYNFLGHFPTARYICPEVVLKYPIEMKKRKIVSWLVHNFSKRALVSTLSTTAQMCFFMFFTKLKNKTFGFIASFGLILPR